MSPLFYTPQPTMISRTILFLAAAGLLAGGQSAIWISRRRGKPFFESDAPETWRPVRLWIASFLTLFAELAFIRWIAVEVRVFAYFKNLALLLCFLGFGLGCALARQTAR